MILDGMCTKRTAAFWRAILICAAMFSQVTAGWAWSYLAAEEDWGTACYAQHKEGEREISILNGHVLLVGPYRQIPDNETNILLELDDDVFELPVTSGDYFGRMYYIEISLEILEKIAASSVLKIHSRIKEEFIFSLTGSRSAISKMKKCVKRN